MEIVLNGKTIQTASSTLAELILETGLDRSSLVAELNRQVVQQKDWAATPVTEADQIELLNFVGGG